MKRSTLALTILLIVAISLSGCAMTVAPKTEPAAQPTSAPASAAASPSLARTASESQVTPAPAVVEERAPAATAAQSAAQATATPATSAAATTALAPTAVATLAADPSLVSVERALEAIYDRVNPSVVLINVAATVTSMQGFPFSGGQTQQGLGSGFVWDKEGHIVTNNHVIDGATSIIVTFYDGATAPATVVGADPDSDLAVIKVKVAADQLSPVVLADSTSVKVGQWAIAIGNPYGEQNTMTTGIVSALGRSLPVSDESSASESYVIPDVIQTDAPINPGNSGGVLLDAQGRVIGVTSAIESTSGASAGIGFAIPSVIVERVVPALIKTGHYDQTWLGITGGDLTADMATAMSLPATQRGALVASVVTGGPAAKAGILGGAKTATIQGQQVQVGGDVIIAIDAHPVKTFSDVVVYLARYTDVGQTVTLTVLRGGKQVDVKVSLQARPSTQASGQGSGQTAGVGAYLGVAGINVTADIARAMNLSTSMRGVLVQEVVTGSPAEDAGLEGSTTSVTISGATVMVGGDIIIGFGGQTVTSVDDLTSLLEQSEPNELVTLTVIRNGRQGRVRVMLGQQPTTSLPFDTTTA